jgi:RNA-directed DNA polymerase
VRERITPFLRQQLQLKGNEAKRAVARPQERQFLGCSVTAGPEGKRVMAPQALARFQQRIREITPRAKGVRRETTREALAPYRRGGRRYFGCGETPAGRIG